MLLQKRLDTERLISITVYKVNTFVNMRQILKLPFKVAKLVKIVHKNNWLENEHHCVRCIPFELSETVNIGLI